MNFRRTLLAASALSLAAALPSGPASAQFFADPAVGTLPVTGLYIAGGAGYNHQTRRDLDATGGNRTYFQGIPASPSGSIRFEGGFVGLGSIGFGFGNGLRLEVEGNYRQNDVDRVSGFGSNTVSRNFRSSGEVQQYGVMGNAFYDFRIPGANVVPYIGGGVGYVWTDVDLRATRNAPGGNTILLNDTEGQFAYQGIAGVAFPLAFAPGLAFTAEYRYLGVVESDVRGRVVTPTGARATSAGGTAVSPTNGQFRVDNANNHSILLGVRYAFNTPRPAVVAVVPPAVQAVARTYLVFFDWDRADLTDRARQIIAEAARNARGTGTTRIELAGHADRSGTPQYNQRLSQRRAEAVAAELTRQGIGRNEIAVTAFGESRPLVPTADGVREPQNRRVEIVLR